MNTIAITPPFADDPIGLELSTIGKAIFEAARVRNVQENSEEIDLRSALEDLRLDFIKTKSTYDNPLQTGFRQFTRKSEVLFDCREPEAIPRLLQSLKNQGRDCLRRALLTHGIGNALIAGPDGFLQTLQIRAAFDERIELRRAPTATLRELAPLFSGTLAHSTRQILIITDSERDQDDALATLLQAREQNALFKRGFRRITFDGGVIEITKPDIPAILGLRTTTPPATGKHPEPGSDAKLEPGIIATTIEDAFAVQGFVTDASAIEQICTVLDSLRRQHKASLNLAELALRTTAGAPLKPYHPPQVFRQLNAFFNAADIDWRRDENSFFLFHFFRKKPLNTLPATDATAAPGNNLAPTGEPRRPRPLDHAEIRRIIQRVAAKMERNKGTGAFLNRLERTLRMLVLDRATGDFVTFGEYTLSETGKKVAVTVLQKEFSSYGLRMQLSGERIKILRLSSSAA